MTETIVNAEFLKQYNVSLRYIKCIGYDVFDRHNTVVMKTLYIIEIIILILWSGSHIAFLLTSIYNVADVIDLSLEVSLCLAAAEGWVLHPILYFGKQRIKSCLLKISKQWRNDSDLDQDLIIIKKKELKAIHCFKYVYSTMIMGFAFFYILGSLLQVLTMKFVLRKDVAYVTTFRFLVPFEWENNFALYVLLCVGDFITVMNLTALINMGLLTFTITMSNLRTLFVILQHEIKKLFDAGDEFDEKEMKRLLKTHIDLLNLIEDLSNAFGNVFAVHLIFVSGTIAFFCLSPTVNGVIENLNNIVASTLVIANFYSVCLYGQLLSDSSVDVGTKIYESKWYNLPIKYQKVMIIIMQRSLKINYVQSISLTEVSLTIFTKVMKITWSILSLTTSVLNED